MSALTIPYTIANGQATDGNKVGSNFAAIKAWADTSAVEVTGATMTGNLVLVGAPTTANMAATKAYVDGAEVVGVVKMFAGAAAPSGFLICDGSAVLRTTYAALFAVIGTTFGAGDGSTTFNLPNLKGRVPVGRDSGQTEFDTLGETGGAKTHTLAVSEMPTHAHDMSHGHLASSAVSDPGHFHSTPNHDHGIQRSASLGLAAAGGTYHFYQPQQNSGTGWGTLGADRTQSDGGGLEVSTVATGVTVGTTVTSFVGTTGNQGSGAAHNNLQPYTVMNFIIKY